MGFFQILLKEIFSLLNNQSAIWVNITLHSSLFFLKMSFSSLQFDQEKDTHFKKQLS